MEATKTNEKDYYVIDVVHIIKSVWQRIWIVVLTGILIGAIGFSIAAFVIQPTYSSAIMLYVNNSSISLNDVGFSISSSDLTASQSLVRTYNVLLKNRTTLERVIDMANLPYTWKELDKMIKASSVDETEIMRVTVTTEDPYEAQRIANSIAIILPQRVTEVVEGSSMAVVDSAIPNLQKVEPSITRYTLIGLILGCLISIIVLAVRAVMDNTIHDEDYIIQNYNYPILAKVPDLFDTGTKKYASYNYYQKSKDKQSEKQGGED